MGLGNRRLRFGHDLFLTQNGEPVFISVRDFRDVSLSWWRVHNDVPFADLKAGRKATRAELDPQLYMVKQVYTEALMPTVTKNENVMVFRYEDFFPDNYEVIFAGIEKHLGIKVSKKLRRSLSAQYSFKRNKYKASRMQSFNEYDSEFIHGLHLWKGRIGGWKDLLSEDLHEYLEQSLADELKTWNYT